MDAERQRHLAESNFQLALTSVNEMLTRISRESLRNVPQLQTVRAEVSERAVTLLEQLSSQNTQNPQIRREIARGYLLLGQLTDLMGSHEKSEQSLRRSIALMDQLLVEDANEVKDRLLLAQCHTQLAGVLRDLGRLDEATAAYRKTGEILKPIQDHEAQSEEIQRSVALSHHNVGRILADRNDFAAAEQEYRQALVVQESLVQRQESRENRRHLAVTHFNLGGLQFETNQLETAEKTTRTAVDLFRKLVDEDPAEMELRQYLADSINNLGMVLYQTGRTDEAHAAFREQVSMLEAMSADYPEVPDLRDEAAVGYGNIAALLRPAGKREEAEQAARSAVNILQALVNQYPGVLVYRVHLASYTNNLGNCLFEKEDYSAASECYRKAVKEWVKACPRRSRRTPPSSRGRTTASTSGVREPRDTIVSCSRWAWTVSGPLNCTTRNISLRWIASPTRLCCGITVW